jgi:hypothetical protein
MSTTIKPLLAVWNLDFTKYRRANIRREIRNRITSRPKGKGAKAWKRVEALDRDPGCLIWPDYALRISQ